MSAHSLLGAWSAAWPAALDAWSRYTRLSPPRFCLSKAEESAEKLSGSFAMIRLTDHAVVVSLRQVEARGLQACALPVLAHEVGHHVLAPGDLADNARLIGRMRLALGGVPGRGPPGPDRSQHAGLVANLYTDLLINDRLQREMGIDVAGVYRVLGRDGPPRDDLFRLYLRIYERLWELDRGALAGPVAPALDLDAELGARVIRAWRREWLRGAGRFALLLRPYLEAPDPAGAAGWLDALAAGVGGGVPDGLADEDDGEGDLVHPAEEDREIGKESVADTRASGAEATKGARGPAEYLSLMGALGVTGTPEQIVARYYRERARRWVIPFPSRPAPRAAEPQPEGLDRWEAGDPLAELDWVATVVQSPTVIPGLTTARRLWEEAPGGEPAREVPDLYLGVDCSGSMPNPASTLSYPVLAGAVMVLSAIRAGASAMVTLSGESPGRWTSTGRFLRQDLPVLEVLTRYLGTGYSFGIERLRDTFVNGPPLRRPTHVLVVSDSDLFHMIRSVTDGEALMTRVATTCGAGATAVLNLPAGGSAAAVTRLEALGWRVERVASQADLVEFARRFSRRTWGRERGR